MTDDLAHSVEGSRRRITKPSGYWTFERVRDAASNFTTRVEFQRRANTPYATAVRRGWIDDVCRHMKPAGNRVRRHVYRIICVEKRMAYIGLSANPMRRLVAHKSNPKGRVAEILALPHTFEVVTDAPIPSKAAQELEAQLIEYYRQIGWTIVNIAKAGGLGGRDAYWTKARLAAEALKFKTRGDMRRSNKAAYVIASRLGIIEEIFARHTNAGLSISRRRNGTWTVDALKAEAAKHTHRKAMGRDNAPAFLAATRLKCLDEIFADHPHNGYKNGRKPHNYWHNIENMRAEVAKYKSRQEFQNKAPGIYSIAWSLGWLSALFANHENAGYAAGKKRIMGSAAV